MTEPSPQPLGRYTIRGEIGRGGFATVYRATDSALEREVALKVLKPGWTDDPKAVERFMREARQASKLKHPNIVTIFDVGQAEGRLFIAMELVRGRSLQGIIAEDGALAWSRALAILEQTSAALDYAHKQGLIHRDIKPANIILDETSSTVHVMLTDFGLVRGAEQASLSMGTTGGLIGTPEYIASEIWNGEPATKASDIYALGCVAFYLLTGQVLFGATTPMAVLKRHVEGPVFPQQWPSGVPDGVEAVLRRALAKEPNQRPASASELVTELRECEKREVKEQGAEQAVQAVSAAEVARRIEEERRRQDAQRKAKEEAERVAQAAAAEKSKREAAELERQRQAAEKEAQRPTTEAPGFEISSTGKSNMMKWVYTAAAIVAVVVIGILIANSSNRPSPATVIPVAVAPTQPPTEGTATDTPTATPTPTETPNVTPTPTATHTPTPTSTPNLSISAANVSQLQPLQRLTGVTDIVRQVVFSPDSEWLAASSGNQSDFNVRVWQIPEGTLDKTLAAPNGIVWSVDFARDGTRIGATSGGRGVGASPGGSVYLWSFPDGALQKVIEPQGVDQAVSITFAPDNERLAVGGVDQTKGGVIWLLHVADGSLISEYSADRVNTTNLAFSPDGKTLAEGASDRVARLVNVEDGAILRSLQLPHQGYSLTMSPDGTLVAIGLCYESGTFGCTTGQVWVWRIVDGEVIYKLDVTDGGMEGVAFSPDGELLAASGGNSILMWRMADGGRVGTLSPPGGRAGSISFSPNGLYLASGERDHGITLWGIQP